MQCLQCKVKQIAENFASKPTHGMSPHRLPLWAGKFKQISKNLKLTVQLMPCRQEVQTQCRQTVCVIAKALVTECHLSCLVSMFFLRYHLFSCSNPPAQTPPANIPSCLYSLLPIFPLAYIPSCLHSFAAQTPQGESILDQRRGHCPVIFNIINRTYVLGHCQRAHRSREILLSKKKDAK